MNRTLVLALAAASLTACGEDQDTSQETRSFTVMIENIAPVRLFSSGGVFNTPVGQADPGPATPGKSYEFTVNAGRKQRLSFVTMLAATNDLFFGPDGQGIALYDEDGEPISGDVTDQIALWDAGTEINEEPGVGPNTVSQQEGPDTGPAENGDVLEISDTDDDFDYPKPEEVMTVTVTHTSGTEFKIKIENISPDDALKTSEGDRPAPLSPGVWVLSTASDPLFTVGTADRAQGLEHIAEDGNPEMLGEFISKNSGVTYPASPGVWVVHELGTMPLFEEGEDDYAKGLEHIAEDGNPSSLGEYLEDAPGYLEGAVFNTPKGKDDPGPIVPGSKYEFTFDAHPGEALSLVTMLAATNDVFFGPKDKGIALFDDEGMPIDGEITDEVYLWDAGTEENEQPAVGPNTVTNQATADTGKKEGAPVGLLSDVDDDDFDYPKVDEVLKITIKSK